VRRFLGLSFTAHSIEFDPVMPPALDGLQLATILFGRQVHVTYRVGPRGCGVAAVRGNGHSLTFSRLPNAYRQGAVTVDKVMLLSQLNRARNELQIDLG
jgi:CRISPR-associated protein Csx3